MAGISDNIEPMSGPVSAAESDAIPALDQPEACDVEVTEGRSAKVGEISVNRLLPRRGRRMVGAWCFMDHMGPATMSSDDALDIGPHPHIGLQTVTWLLEGQILHRDSLGSEQLIRPGQLNLMTAGHGVSHSEETRGVYSGVLHGVQLWVAQPESTRDAAPEFEHHADLPRLELQNGSATVLVGSLGSVSSPARRDTEHSGAELDLRPGRSTLPLLASHEHAVAVLSGSVSIRGTRLEPGSLGYLGLDLDEVELDAREPSRVLLVGGLPFPEEVLMWWNYVVRDRDEIIDAHRAWRSDDGRFGSVDSPLERIVVDDPPWRSN